MSINYENQTYKCFNNFFYTNHDFQLHLYYRFGARMIPFPFLFVKTNRYMHTYYYSTLSRQYLSWQYRCKLIRADFFYFSLFFTIIGHFSEKKNGHEPMRLLWFILSFQTKIECTHDVL